MKSIAETLSSEVMTPQEQLTAVVIACHGYAMFDGCESFDPRSYAIPSEQWKKVCGWLQGLPGDRLDRVNLSLDWMNVGPSAYETKEGVGG
jgi:hypothetical protein